MTPDNTLPGEKKTSGGPFWSIGSKLIFSFCLMFSVLLIVVESIGLVGVPYTSFSGRKGQQRKEALNSLSTLADLKKEQLLKVLRDVRLDIHLLAINPIVGDKIGQVKNTLKRFRARGRKESEIWNFLQERKIYRDMQTQLENMVCASPIFEKIQIADARTGEVLVSTDDSTLGTKVSSFSFLTGGLPPFGDFMSEIKLATSPYCSSPVIYISHPLNDSNGQAVAVLVIEANVEAIIAPVLHTGAGLGKTGEALLVNQDMKILASLKFPLPDGSRAEPLVYQIRAKPALLAVNGQEGITEYVDYRGKRVLAAYRHILITPDRSWGMVVKRDKAEIFAPLYQDMAYRTFIGVTGIVLIVVLTTLIARSITKPISALGKTAKKVADGDLQARVPISASGEAGLVIQTFNYMIQRIQNWHEELEEKLQERTARLNSAIEMLEKEIAERKRIEKDLQLTQFAVDHLSDAAFWIGADARFLYVNEAACKSLGYSREELLKMRVHDIDPWFSPELWRERWRKLKKLGSITLESIHRAKDGRTFPVEINANFMVFEDKE